MPVNLVDKVVGISIFATTVRRQVESGNGISYNDDNNKQDGEIKTGQMNHR
jgi:hypothetical protein